MHSDSVSDVVGSLYAESDSSVVLLCRSCDILVDFLLFLVVNAGLAKRCLAAMMNLAIFI